MDKRLSHHSPEDISDSPENIRGNSRDIRDGPKDTRDGLKDIHDNFKNIQDSPKENHDSRGRVDRNPTALPAAPSVVAIVTNRQITISAIPYIIIYIRAVTL